MNRNLPAFVRICFYNEMWLDVCLFLLLFQEEAHHFIVKSPIWLIAHRQVNPCLFIYNALIMRKRIKSDLSVISAHSTFSKSPKSHFCCGKMNDRIIDTSAAKTTSCSDLFNCCFIGSKEVKRQRVRMCIDDVDHVIQMVKCQTGITGPKISSCITASSNVTLSRTVGSMRRAFASEAPPCTTF